MESTEIQATMDFLATAVRGGDDGGAFYVGNGWVAGVAGMMKLLVITSDDWDHSRKFPAKHQ